LDTKNLKLKLRQSLPFRIPLTKAGYDPPPQRFYRVYLAKLNDAIASPKPEFLVEVKGVAPASPTISFRDGESSIGKRATCVTLLIIRVHLLSTI
jgi:hypothetical protein